MASSLKEAFIKAGIKKATDMTEKRMTQLERIWRFVNDHPGCTLREVHSVLKFKATAQGLNSLLSRGMVKVTKEERTGYGPHGTARVINLYRVAFKDFELLPLPPKAKSAASKQVTTKPLDAKWRAESGRSEVAAPAAIKTVEALREISPKFGQQMNEVASSTSESVEDWVDGWDVAKARKVFQHLKKSFS